LSPSSFIAPRCAAPQFEVKVSVPFLKDGAFIAQSLATYSTARAIRRLGVLTREQFGAVEQAVFRWLGR
jgi:hypothetical protein